MSKKRKNSTSVIITVIVTLIVLAGLTFAGVKYILPYYLQGQADSTEIQFQIYQYAVKLFPLLIGLVLIVIASLIASSRDDEEDDEDKLPPNSYEKQYFDVPSDDPEESSVPQFTPEEEEEFVSIFDTQEPEVKSFANAEDAEAESEIEKSDVNEESETDDEAVEVAPAEEKKDDLVSAIYSLVNRIDKMTDLMTYEEDDFEEEGYEEDEVEEFDELDSVEPVKSETYDALVARIDSLSLAVSELSKIVTNQVAVAPAPVQQNVEEEEVEEPQTDESVEPVVEEPIEEAVSEDISEEPVVEENTDELDVVEYVEAPVVESVVNPEDLIADVKDYEDCSAAERFARLEFDSAKDSGYDISYVFTEASLDAVNLSLSGLGDAFEVNGKTMVVIPFLSNDEICAEFDKLDAPYECKTISAEDSGSFEDSVGTFQN